MKKMILMAFVILVAALQMEVNAQVKIGDIMEKSGTKGMVVYVDESGQHGLLMSVKKVPTKQRRWCSKEFLRESVGAKDENDGMKNTQAVVDFAKKKGVSLKDAFPLFDWAVNTCGEGWYIPAINELLKMAEGIGDKSQEGFNYNVTTDRFKAFEKSLKKAKGESMLYEKNIASLQSSTELKRNADGSCNVSIVNFTILFDSKGAARGKAELSALTGGLIKNSSGKGMYKRLDLMDKKGGDSAWSRAFYKF